MALVGEVEFRLAGIDAAAGAALAFSLRPEALQLLAAGEAAPAGWAALAATLVRVEFLGALTRLEARLAGGVPLRVALLDRGVAALERGAELRLAYDPRRLVAFGVP